VSGAPPDGGPAPIMPDESVRETLAALRVFVESVDRRLDDVARAVDERNRLADRVFGDADEAATFRRAVADVARLAPTLADLADLKRREVEALERAATIEAAVERAKHAEPTPDELSTRRFEAFVESKGGTAILIAGAGAFGSFATWLFTSGVLAP
jgi:ABC-type transporter Mla subunit MlaD